MVRSLAGVTNSVVELSGRRRGTALCCCEHFLCRAATQLWGGARPRLHRRPAVLRPRSTDRSHATSGNRRPGADGRPRTWRRGRSPTKGHSSGCPAVAQGTAPPPADLEWRGLTATPPREGVAAAGGYPAGPAT